MRDEMTSHTATIIDFSVHRERRASATAAAPDFWRSEAVPNFAFMIMPVSVPMFWYHVWVSSLFPCRKKRNE
jgi:hypothetical protein